MSAKADWNPDAYAAFRSLRLRPALDLLMAVPAGLTGGEIIDLGCGDGAAAGSLGTRFPKRKLIGIDGSPAMLAKARGYDQTVEADIATWAPDSAPALIFSNATLHWLADHATLMPRLAGFLPRFGTLAVQMPRQQMAPSHALMREIGAAMFPDRFDFAGWQPQVAAPAFYHRLLAPLGAVSVWESEYLQRLDPVAEGHPVRHFTQSTAMRPFAEKLSASEAARFVAAYEAELARHYPPEADGSVLFAFRRLFFTLTRA